MIIFADTYTFVCCQSHRQELLRKWKAEVMILPNDQPRSSPACRLKWVALGLHSSACNNFRYSSVSFFELNLETDL